MSETSSSRRPLWGFLSVVLILPLFGGCAREEPERTIIRPVRAVMVEDAAGLQGRGFPGRAQATQEIDLAFRVGGPLITRPVNVGDEVKEGDVVARIDPRDFEVNLRNVQAQLAEATAAFERARGDFRRQKNIFEKDPGATSEAAVDRAREERDRAAANVESLTASVRTAQDQLDDTSLKSPFDGTVVTTFVENFQNVRQKEPIGRILDTSHIEMVVNVPEDMIVLAPRVETVSMRFDAFPNRQFEGTIIEIGREASQTTRTFPVTLIMEQPEDIKILPGMAGTARATRINLPDEQQTTGVVVPTGAIFTPNTETRSHVWIIEPAEGDLGVLERRPVSTGDLTRQGVMVTDGLSAGEWIVTAGVHSVHEGQTVRILNRTGG